MYKERKKAERPRQNKPSSLSYLILTDTSNFNFDLFTNPTVIR